MTLRVHIQDARGERDIPAEFPLDIGGGASSGIQVPGFDPVQPACRITRSADTLQVEPTTTTASVSLNGRPLKSPVVLADGDYLEFAGARIRCRIGDEDCGFFLVGGRNGPDTLPPPETARVVEETPIEPATFAPADARSQGARDGRGLLRPVLYAGFAVLAAVVWFVFTARYVTLVVTPEPDRLAVSGGLLRIPLGEGFLLRPGRYELTAEKPGYHRLVRQFAVSGKRNQVLRYEMEKLPGILAVRSLPITQAQVLIDGEERGTTPVVLDDLVPGPHRVVVRAERYIEANQEVAIEGRGIRQELVVTLVPAWASVSVDSMPSGAILWVDGEQAGPTPHTVDLLAGSHGLELKAPGHKRWRAQLEVLPNQPQAVGPITLQEADGTLHLTSHPEAATVTLDGQYAGTTPLKLSLRPRQAHRITLSKAGYRSATRTPSLEAEETRELAVQLQAVTGVVRVVVEPNDAEVLVDGRSRGAGSTRLALLAVPHEITVRKKGFESYRSRVTPRPGYSQVIRAVLKPPGSFGPGARPKSIKAPDGQELRLVEPGQFRMGASRREQGRRGNETLHKVALIRPFYLGSQEITNAQFRRFQPDHRSGSWMGLDLDGNQQPVVNVTWEQAAGYCNWLSKRASLPTVYEKKGSTLTARQPLGTGFRLPTEAEWAWAARRAGRPKSNKFPWGNDLPPPPRSGNFADQSIARLLANTLPTYSDGYPASAPAGKFQPNNLGVHDLGGNVAEWTHDYYTIYPYAPDQAIKDPQGPPEGKHHTVRGSSWMHASISNLRWTFRDYSNKPRPDLGFRCARYAK